MKKYLIIILLCLLLPIGAVYAQTPEPYKVSLTRLFGYGGFGQVQGNMELSIKGDLEAVSAVQYLMDGAPMGSLLAEEPYKLRFITDDYPSGAREIGAVITLKDGTVVNAQPYKVAFLSSAEAGNATKKILIPIGIVVIGSLLVSAFLQLKTGKVTPGSYGPMGGVVCPKCGKPAPRSIFGLNLVTGKLQRCPHCGKWSIVRRASADELARAEAVLLGDAIVNEPYKQKTDGESKTEALEDTRYTDL